MLNDLGNRLKHLTTIKLDEARTMWICLWRTLRLSAWHKITLTHSIVHVSYFSPVCHMLVIEHWRLASIAFTLLNADLLSIGPFGRKMTDILFNNKTLKNPKMSAVCKILTILHVILGLNMFMQGGPGLSGAGLGNFAMFGPVDQNGVSRNHTWVSNIK